MLGAAGGNEVEGHMGRTADVLVRKSATGALVASTHHTLTDKVSSPDHKDKQDDGNDWTNGVRPSIGDATGGRRHIFYTEKEEEKEKKGESSRILGEEKKYLTIKQYIHAYNICCMIYYI